MMDEEFKTGSLFGQDMRTKKRHRAEKYYRMRGLAAIFVALFMLFVLGFSIITRGSGAFFQTRFELDVYLNAAVIDPKGERDMTEIQSVMPLSYRQMIQDAVDQFTEKNTGMYGVDPDIKSLLSKKASVQLRDYVLANPDQIGETATVKFLATAQADGILKERVKRTDFADNQKFEARFDLVHALEEKGVLSKSFNLGFITGADASDRNPEAAGIGVALVGSLSMIFIVALLALPLGVFTAVYLEEIAPKNRLTDIIEVNISNLAAVPSIVFGVLGLVFFVNMLGLPTSAPIVGGLVLALMTLPKIIIPARMAIKAVPPSIRDAALGVGASRMQVIFHHVLPLAMPGILTGTIIGLSQALGESAPLLLIGMVGLVATRMPDGLGEMLFSPNSALPAQIYTWSTRADPAFYERAWGGIIVLLVFLVLMNTVAIILRRRFERRW